MSLSQNIKHVIGSWICHYMSNVRTRTYITLGESLWAQVFFSLLNLPICVGRKRWIFYCGRAHGSLCILKRPHRSQPEGKQGANSFSHWSLSRAGPHRPSATSGCVYISLWLWRVHPVNHVFSAFIEKTDHGIYSRDFLPHVHTHTTQHSGNIDSLFT